MIHEINKLIANGALEKALVIVNEEIMKSSNTGSYHEMLFAKARIYIIKYKDTRPLNNSLFDQAKEIFAQGDNAYKALHGKQHPDYQTAINTSNKIYTELNQCK